MILIIGSQYDISTDYVMEWCHALGVEVLRLNEPDTANLVSEIRMDAAGTDVLIRAKGRTVPVADISAVWFRRGYIHHGSRFNDDPAGTNRHSIRAFLENESATLTEFLVYMLQQKQHINAPDKYNANKLIVLAKAAKAGFQIPDTLITRDAAQVAGTFKGRMLVTKSIQDGLNLELDHHKFSPSVHVVPACSKFPGAFYYSKFQERIDARYELRVFFIGDSYYAGARFPSRSGTDNGGTFHTRRIVPFRIPAKLLAMLRRFNDDAGFNSGSLDILVDRHDAYYFLEINPVGQYDFLSKICNYHLDYEIAHYLKTCYETNDHSAAAARVTCQSHPQPAGHYHSAAG